MSEIEELKKLTKELYLKYEDLGRWNRDDEWAFGEVASNDIGRLIEEIHIGVDKLNMDKS